MRVGLYDYDLHPEGINGLSIDLLKLAADYRNKNDICSLIPNFDNYSLYTKIHYWADLNDHYLSRDIAAMGNIEPGGIVFGIPIPAELENIQYNTSIYTKWFEKYGDTRQRSKERIRQILRGNNIRIFRDGKLINFEKNLHLSNKTIIIHDRFLFDNNGWKDVFDDLRIDSAIRFGFRHPIEIDNVDILHDIKHYPLSQYFSNFHYAFDTPKEDFLEFCCNFNKNADNKNVFILSKKRFESNQEKILYLKKIISRAIFCWTLQKSFLLNYRTNSPEDDFDIFIKLLIKYVNTKGNKLCPTPDDLTFINFLIYYVSDVDWGIVNKFLELDPEIKKMCCMSPHKMIEELLI